MNSGYSEYAKYGDATEWPSQDVDVEDFGPDDYCLGCDVIDRDPRQEDEYD